MALQQAITQSAPSYQSGGLWAIFTLLIGWGGWKSIGVVGPSLEAITDRLWMRAFTRNRTLLEKELRTEVFQDDLASHDELKALVRTTAEQVATLAGANQETQRVCRESVAAIAKSVEASTKDMQKKIDRTARDVTFVAGQISIMSGNAQPPHDEDDA